MFSSRHSVGTLDLMQCDVWDRAASEDEHKLSQQQVRLILLFLSLPKFFKALLATKNPSSEVDVRDSKPRPAGHQLAHSGPHGDPAV